MRVEHHERMYTTGLPDRLARLPFRTVVVRMPIMTAKV